MGTPSDEEILATVGYWHERAERLEKALDVIVDGLAWFAWSSEHTVVDGRSYNVPQAWEALQELIERGERALDNRDGSGKP